MGVLVTERLSGPTQRIAVAGALIVILVGAAIGVTVWRFDVSAGKYDETLENGSTVAATAEARTSVYDVLDAARRLTSTRSGTDVLALRDAGVQLTSKLSSIARATAGSHSEQLALRQAQSAAAQIVAGTGALAAGAGTATAIAQADRIATLLGVVDHQLDVVDAHEQAQTQADQRSARSSASTAKLVGILTGGLAV
ncbi:MAG TPA: hypothetical protein VGH56_05985, partial [Solirubrobacteraceae bacterium]